MPTLYRYAWLVAGVSEGLELPGVPAAIVPWPNRHAGRDMPQLLTDALGSIGYVTVIQHPMWMASSEARRPLALLTVGPRAFDTVQEATQALPLMTSRLLDLSTLTHGSTPTVFGGAGEILQESATAWRTFAVYTAGGNWPGGQLGRRLPDGVGRPVAKPERWWEAMAADPRLAIWAALARGAADSPDRDLRVLRRCTLLETMGSELLADAWLQRTDDGRQPYTGRSRQTFLREWIAGLLEWTSDRTHVDLATLLPRGCPGLWEAAHLWADWRNAIAHNGYLNPADQRAEGVIGRAQAVTGAGSAKEGLEEYAAALEACVELILLALVEPSAS